ncbi:FAD-dependent oxidoreductase [Salinibacter sp. 10B]|uniref:phytoene desaturase family protein n=1 Tax=Salinibacter sp. 10B TaxID=1923971 RepID=UPI000CF53879|nr:NAD(P)/FAD-dependent oxidoreductase [Salinibacter sp. 10B]PQJ33475.1 FAD-dependent oxidoreductase [Salinibacter sp. 10B]
MDYDVITIGAGHNGLITAAYLAQAGYRVAVFERRDIVGGAVSTKELIPGYQIDLGGSAHILIRQTPVVQELELEQYGLTYIDLDPMFVAPFPDGDTVFIHRDLDRTIHHLESKFPGEGEAYQRFVTDWQGFARTMRDLFLASPTPWQIGKRMVMGESTPLPWHEELRHILRPYEHVVRSYFSEEKLQTLIAWMAAQSGPPPTEPLTGPFALWHALYHEGGVARPKGGSGMLTQALRTHLEAHGGEVFTEAPVQEILVENGVARGVRVNSELYTSRAVCAATHAKETFDHLLPAEHRPNSADGLRIGNGFGIMLRLALDQPVEYAAHSGDEARMGLQLLCRDLDQLHTAYGDYLSNRPASDPPIVAMTFSAADDSLAPAGGEVLWLWGQYFPYELAGEQSWSEIADTVADNLISQFETYAPGIRDHIVGQLFQHPVWLENNLGLFRGNVMHLEMSLDQMFAARPALGLSSYKGPIDQMYLTGASTHPGGGIMGASGRNAARVILSDLA